MSADIKWKPVGWAQLQHGDRIRALGTNGDVIHGTFEERGFDQSYLRTDFGRHFVMKGLVQRDYRFEREVALTERVLPTEPGLYAENVNVAMDDYNLYVLNIFGHWQTDDSDDARWVSIPEARVPDGLVQLVPVTEVEELRDRLNSIRTSINLGTLELAGSGNRDYLLRLLDGEA